MNTKKWEILNKVKSGDIVDILLENRGVRTKKEKEEFLNPKSPKELTLKELDIEASCVNESIHRIKQAIKRKEKAIIYGDYDADGISASAILWEALHAAGLDVLPYIPNRFEEGYGINFGSISNLKSPASPAGGQISNLSLVITVDNGIVANEDIDKINKLGIDVIITDHHLVGKKLPKAYSIIHTPKICGSALAWVLAREIRRSLPLKDSPLKVVAQSNQLELAGIGTIADQMPLIGVNRSFAKYGIESLRKTQRPGLLALFKEAGIDSSQIGTYEINYVIAPRINAMGRLAHGLDSLRLLCTRDAKRAGELAQLLSRTNLERQKVVDEVVVHAREMAGKIQSNKVIILAHESYHEGVIGLAAGKLVEEFYKPAIVISKGIKLSKASARSVSGFNIIEAIRKLDDMLEGGGGHPMAAGFSIKTSEIDLFIQRFAEVADPLLTEEILTKKLRIDCEIGFEGVTYSFLKALQSFEPAGLGNPSPTFVTRNVEIVDAKPVGRDQKHLKLKLKENSATLDAIAFGFGSLFSQLAPGKKVDVVYGIEENVWNGNKSLQLKIKDLKISI